MIKLEIPAQLAQPKPPLTSILGQNKIPLDSFCKEFNSLSQNYKKEIPIQVLINPMNGKNYKIKLKLPNLKYFKSKLEFNIKQKNEILLFQYYLNKLQKESVEEFDIAAWADKKVISLRSIYSLCFCLTKKKTIQDIKATFNITYSYLLSSKIKIILD